MVTVTMNIIFDNSVVRTITSSVYWIFNKLGHMIPCERGRTLFTLGPLSQKSRSPLLWIKLLTTGSFSHDNFSSVYWIFTKLSHMIPLCKGKNPIYFGIIIIIPFDNLYRRTYFVMHTFLVYNASPLKQQFADRHAAPSDTLSWFRSKQFLLFLFNAACLA
jgi:hypothetical protein